MLIVDDLDKLLEVLPNFIKNALKKHSNNKLLEIVMDLGRRPEARFVDQPHYLSRKLISWQDLDYCIKRIGRFSGDNRSGIEKTLHRISSIRNRQGNIVGLTCRVGRALFGTISIIRDLLEKQQSILILGRPGIGKTTAIREIARILADEMQKRVIVIDTSNEIGGDGDVPHPAIGRARRMQVTLPELQHQVMIEAVENHMPQVIIIDEISTELEVLAARTIAERGVQLVGTVHGNFLNSLIKNPTLCDLVGGIQYVTLGDDEAKRRGTQKSILERKTTPAFQVAIEIHKQQSWVVHEKLDVTIDQILQGYRIAIQCRDVLPNGKVTIYGKDLLSDNSSSNVNKLDLRSNWHGSRSSSSRGVSESKVLFAKRPCFSTELYNLQKSEIVNNNEIELIKLYVYLIDYVEVNKVIKVLRAPLIICKDINKADAVLALRCRAKQNTRLRQIAHLRQIMIYTIHVGTSAQIAHALKRVINCQVKDSINWQNILRNKTKVEIEALEETRAAIENILLIKKQPVQLLPRASAIRKIQQQLIKMYDFRTRTFGENSHRCLRIYLI